MSTIFTPPLSTHTVICLPRSSSPSKCTINFRALPSSSSSLPLRTDLPLPQLWTNLGGSEWRAIPFLPLDSAQQPTPPSDEAASWPILSLSNESPPLLPPVLPRLATLSFDVDQSFAGKEFGFTYRLQHPNQSIEWLGSDGSNGSFRFELDKEAGGDGEGEGGEPLLGGRWKKEEGGEASEEEDNNKKRSWVGGEGEVLPGVRIGQGWEGFGVSMDERDTPTAHILTPSSTTTPALSTILLHPTASNPPIHHVGLPSTPIILSADPSSYFLASGSAIRLKHSVDGFAPKATSFHSDATTSPSLPAGLDLLPSSGETTALLSTKTKAIFLHSTTASSPFPISIDLSKTFSSFESKTSKSLAVYSESGGSVVQLDEGGGGGFLVHRLDGPLSTLKVVELSRVAGSDHLLVGSIDPPLTSHSKVEDAPITTTATLKPVSSFVEDLSETASEPNEEVVNGANSEEEDANSDEETTSHARVLGGGGAEIERRGGFAAFLRWWATLWQAVLSLFGVAHKETPTKTVTFDEEEEVIPATETTPLLTHANHSHTPSASSTLTSSPIVTKVTLPPSPSPTPLFYAPSGLRGGLLISSSGSSRDAPNLVLKARLASTGSSEAWTALKFKGELETVSNSQGGNWFKGTVVVEGENLVGQGNGEGEDWAVWVGEKEE